MMHWLVVLFIHGNKTRNEFDLLVVYQKNWGPQSHNSHQFIKSYYLDLRVLDTAFGDP